MKKILTLLLCTTQVALSGQDRGGQYEFYQDNTERDVQYYSEMLSNDIRDLSKQQFDELFDLKPVDQAELVNILENLVFSPAVDNRIRKNPNGSDEVLMLDYVIINGEKRVEVLRPFLQYVKSTIQNVPTIQEVLKLYAAKDPDGRLKRAKEQVKLYQRHLLHEALHFYGYNQEEAWLYSENVNKIPGLAVQATLEKNEEIRVRALKNSCQQNTGTKCERKNSSRDQIRRSIIDWFTKGSSSDLKIVFPLKQDSFEQYFLLDLSSRNTSRNLIFISKGKPNKVVQMPITTKRCGAFKLYCGKEVVSKDPKTEQIKVSYYGGTLNFSPYNMYSEIQMRSHELMNFKEKKKNGFLSWDYVYPTTASIDNNFFVIQ